MKALSHTLIFLSLVTHVLHDTRGKVYCITVVCFFFNDFLLLFCSKVPMGKQKYQRILKNIKSLTKIKDTWKHWSKKVHSLFLMMAMKYKEDPFLSGVTLIILIHVKGRSVKMYYVWICYFRSPIG